ncbi:MAG: hypothetical protein HQL65_05935, partial [Magnetococcales bacterium]|nr:hypothetical protein [Magnetococcales bacterium]
MDYQAVFDKIWATLDRVTEKSEAEHARIQKKLDYLAESSIRLDAQIDRVDKQLGDMGNRLGEYVESMVAPACETLFA